MPRYRYKGVLASRLKDGEQADAKMPALFDDLGIDPKSEDASLHALFALAARHVRGFQRAQTGRRPGRRKALQSYIRDVTAEFGPLFGSLAEEAARAGLHTLVERARKTMTTAGGRRYTKKELVTKISRWEPRPGFENPYFGIRPATLLSWVTHSGPRSAFHRKRAQKMTAAIDSLQRFLETADFKA